MSTHDECIQDQFARQAVPFSKVKWHNHEELLSLIMELARMRPTDTVLDVACGPGIVACEAARHAKTVTGIDVVPAMLEEARRRQSDARLTNVDWCQADAYSLPFGDDVFSRVFTRFSFHHLMDPERALREMWRTAASGARIVITDVYVSERRQQAEAYDHMEKLRDPSHVRTLRLRELTEMFDAMGAEDLHAEFFRLEVELEKQLSSSFPNPGDDEKIRKLLRRDLSENRMGVNPIQREGKIYFSYPIVVMAGNKA